MKRIFALTAMLLIIQKLNGQSTNNKSLIEIISLAQAQSSRSKVVKTEKEISYYQYQTYKSGFKPQINFYGNAPVYNKEFYGVRQPDGTILYKSINQNNSNLGLGISQQIPFTGGSVSLNTNLVRFDDFNSKTKQFNGTPIYLLFNQPLFGVNEIKWQKIIEPLRFEESSKKYILEMENIALQAINFYFDVLEAQSNIDIATINLDNAKQNYEIEKKRVNLGTTTEDKLLQLELQVLRNNQDIEKAKYDLQISQLNLRTFIGTKINEDFEFTIPEVVPQIVISLSDALFYAKKNRPDYISFVRKLSEAERDVALAKAEKRQVNLLASYGLNNVGENISNVYKNPNAQQRFSIGFNIPIIDWGRRNARYNTAKALEKLITANNELDGATIEQEITTFVKNIELLKSNITLGKITDSVAQRRFVISNSLYQLGKLSITDLNFAQNEKDNARRSYINALRAYWNSYYMIRAATLFDFENNISLK